MIARGHLDIGWSDLAYGIAACARPSRRAEDEREVQIACARPDALICLSVRSGFDAFLTLMDYPPGSEILMSAITIRSMVDIVEEHGLVAVPVDLDMATLSVSERSLMRALSPRSKAVVVAHLFGSRMGLAEVAAFAQTNGLHLIEDCAQSFGADGNWGHPSSDISLTSFGPLKTATALGGAVAMVRDPSLRDRFREEQGLLPDQSRLSFLLRICKYGLFKALLVPPLFGLFFWWCNAVGRRHDDVIGRSVRGFSGDRFFWSIRQRPSAPLLRLMARRLREYPRSRLDARVATAEAVDRNLPAVPRPGRQAVDHTHWLFPVLYEDPDRLVGFLAENGFDATRARWSLHVVPPPEGHIRLRVHAAQVAMGQVVYLPVRPQVSEEKLTELTRLVSQFVAQDSGPS